MSKSRRNRCRSCFREKDGVTSKDSVRQWFREVVLLGMTISFIPDLVVSGADNIFGYCPFYEQCSEIEFTGMVKLVFGLLFGILTILIVRLIINGKVKSSSVSRG